jgi:class 3 adenylate cyclase
MSAAQHPFTLAFRDPALERAYGDAAARAGLRQYRIATAAGALLAASAWFADPDVYRSPANIAIVHTLRLSLIPVMAALLAVGYLPWRWYRRSWQPAVTLAMLTLFGFAAASAARVPDPLVLDIRTATVGTIVFAVAGCTAMSWRFIHALLASTLGTAALAVVIAVRWHGADYVTPLLFWIATGSAAGVMAAYLLEKRDRVAFSTARLLDLERARSERLLRNVLPETIAERLKDPAAHVADHFEQATVLFADLVGFTPLAAGLRPAELVSTLDEVFSAFDDIADRHGLEKIKTIGDAYMVVGGVPVGRHDHASAVAEMALGIKGVIEARRFHGHQLTIRIGIHSGPVVAGVIGKRKFLYDLWGDTVNTASRLESHGVPGGIQVSAATYELLRTTYRLTSRGEIAVKGKGEMPTWMLEGRLQRDL